MWQVFWDRASVIWVGPCCLSCVLLDAGKGWGRPLCRLKEVLGRNPGQVGLGLAWLLADEADSRPNSGRNGLAGPSVCAILGSLEKREKIGSGPTRFAALVFASSGKTVRGAVWMVDWIIFE